MRSRRLQDDLFAIPVDRRARPAREHHQLKRRAVPCRRHVAATLWRAPQRERHRIVALGHLIEVAQVERLAICKLDRLVLLLVVVTAVCAQLLRLGVAR